MSVGIHRIDQHCCASCRWWNGSRTIDFNGGSTPRYIKAEVGLFDCLAHKSKRTAATSCPRFMKWERLP